MSNSNHQNWCFKHAFATTEEMFLVCLCHPLAEASGGFRATTGVDRCSGKACGQQGAFSMGSCDEFTHRWHMCWLIHVIINHS